jgi:hypothetical protein
MSFAYNPFTDNLDYKAGGGGGGGVTSVSGTAGRITSTGGANPVIDIDATYVGQTSINTLGTVTTGAWNATAIGSTYGGTGQTTYAKGDILYASAVNTLSKLTAGSDSQVLTLAGGVPTWSTPSSTDLHDSRFIVSAGGAADGANYSTIASAITAAVAAGGVQTIMIQPGTYTENLTLPANINLSAHVADAFTPNVTINGKITCSDAGSRSISGIRLKTNSDFCLVVSGSVATVVYLVECYIQASNNTAISYTSSSSSSRINFFRCNGDIETTLITLFSSSGSGIIHVDYCKFVNSGNSTTASTLSAGGLQSRVSYFNNPFTFSSSAGCDFNNSVIYTADINTTALTVNSTSGSGNNCFFSRFDSGTASSISIGASATCRVYQCVCNSSNTNAITGLGTLSFNDISFIGSSSTINTTTQTAVYSDLGKYRATKQPAFFAIASIQSNVTGDGVSLYTINYVNEIFDQDNNYDGTSLFTAPITGKYFLFSINSISGLTSSHTSMDFLIVTSNRSYSIEGCNPGVQNMASNYKNSGAIIADMDAGDTARVRIMVGGSTKVVGITASANFGGNLVC